jgi:hypothetical protein
MLLLALTLGPDIIYVVVRGAAQGPKAGIRWSVRTGCWHFRAYGFLYNRFDNIVGYFNSYLSNFQINGCCIPHLFRRSHVGGFRYA